MKKRTASKSKFNYDRLWGIVDNLVSNVLWLILVLILPALLGFVLKLDIQNVLLIILLVCQLFIFGLLFVIRRDLTEGTGWRLRREEGEHLWEAQRSLNFLGKTVKRAENGVQVMAFRIRNDAKQVFEVVLARLVLNPDAPLVLADISPKNRPIFKGFLTCTLLFDREIESKRLALQEEANLNLWLERRFTKAEMDRIPSVPLGYIDVTALFRDEEVSFLIFV